MYVSEESPRKYLVPWNRKTNIVASVSSDYKYPFHFSPLLQNKTKQKNLKTLEVIQNSQGHSLSSVLSSGTHQGWFLTWLEPEICLEASLPPVAEGKCPLGHRWLGQLSYYCGVYQRTCWSGGALCFRRATPRDVECQPLSSWRTVSPVILQPQILSLNVQEEQPLVKQALPSSKLTAQLHSICSKCLSPLQVHMLKS